MQYCGLCEADLASPWLVRDAKTGKPLDVAMCPRCGLVQLADLPRDEQLRTYYSHHYREDYKQTHRPRPKHVHRAGRAALDRLAFMRRAGIAPDGARLLDIGAGGGEFCYLAARAGFVAEGIEPHQGYSDFAREQYDIAVQTCDLAEAPARQFEVVTMFHVFEHLAHPRAAMQRIASLLGERGMLVVEVPNIHQADASPHNIWFAAHLFYYSRHSLLAAASPYFECVHVEDRGNLFMALRRRSGPPGAMQWPTPPEVEHTRRRLASKGWAEYLLRGGGLFKPVRRIGRLWREARLGHASPRAVLDAVWETDGHAATAASLRRAAQRPA